MPLFARALPRLAILLLLLVGFCLISPDRLARGPDLCVWRRLLNVAACPACGSTRALAAFFHGRLQQAYEYNRNVVVTAPALLLLSVLDSVELARELLRRRVRKTA